MRAVCQNVAAGMLRSAANHYSVRTMKPTVTIDTIRAVSSRSGVKNRKPVSVPRNSIKKRARVTKAPEGSVESTWYTPSKGASSSLELGRYGLKRLDYQVVRPSLFPPPPHPPGKTFLEKYLYPLTLVTIAGIAIWAYLNPEEDDMKEYWKRVETGQILMDDDDDDDGDEDWDDDDDDEDED